MNATENQFRWQVTGRTASVLIGTKMFQIHREHPKWDKVEAMLRSGEHDAAKLRRWMDPIHEIVSKGKGIMTVTSGGLKFKGKPVNQTLSDRVVQVLDEKGDILPWISFTDKLMRNPVESSREELYLFLQAAKLPLTIDGDFLAYKKVGADYFDTHNHTVDYSIGNVATMKRALVDPDRNELCSTGLHFASRGYLNSFYGARTIAVKVSPQDVVAIPSDYNNAKGRAWRIESVGELVGNGHLIEWPSPWKAAYVATPDPTASQADGMEKEIVTDTNLRNQSVVTKDHGVLTRNRLIAMRKQHGNWSTVANTLGVSTGTVAAWVAKLGLVAKPRSN